MSDVREFRTAQGATIRTQLSPEGDEIGLTIALDGRHDARRVTAFLTPEEYEEISDGYHTFAELYRFRMLYHAAFVNEAHQRNLEWKEGPRTVKSWKHSDGEPCFGGGWFIVVTHLWDAVDGEPSGQISNHYPAADWDLFHVPEVEEAPIFDGHTPADVLDRLEKRLRHG